MENRNKNVPPVRATYDDIVRWIVTDVAVVHNDQIVRCKAMWDTGATMTRLDANMVNELNLEGKGSIKTLAHSGTSTEPFYYVDIVLSNNVTFKDVRVSASVLDSMDFTVIIGMDIIQDGVFIIDNSSGKTEFSFIV